MRFTSPLRTHGRAKLRRVRIVGLRRIDALAVYEPYARADVIDAPYVPLAGLANPGLTLVGARVHEAKLSALDLAAHPVLSSTAAVSPWRSMTPSFPSTASVVST